MLCALFLASLPVAAQDIAGRVSRLSGTAIATAGGLSRGLRLGADVHIGDKISTARNTRLQMTMTDDAVITLGDHSFFVIEEYGDAGQGGSAALELIQGVFLAASGALTKVRPDNVVIATPLASIGIRGTEFWGEQSSRSLTVALLDGLGVYIENPDGRVDLTETGAFTTVTGFGVAPTTPTQIDPDVLAAARRTVTFP